MPIIAIFNNKRQFAKLPYSHLPTKRDGDWFNRVLLLIAGKILQTPRVLTWLVTAIGI